jgi:hypothetical protein
MKRLRRAGSKTKLVFLRLIKETKEWGGERLNALKEKSRMFREKMVG